MKLFKFWAPWCGPCKVLSKRMEGFDTCELVELNIEDESSDEFVEKFMVKNIPLLVLVGEDGNEIKRWSGLVDVESVKKGIEELKP